MAYCTEANIESEIQMDFSATTELTSTELASIIAETDAEIDSKLGDKYVVPITGSTALILMRRIAVLINTGKVQELYGFKYDKEAETETKQSAPARLLRGMRMLNDLVKGITTLCYTTNGATLRVANQKVASSYDDDVKASDYTDFGTNYDKDKW